MLIDLLEAIEAAPRGNFRLEAIGQALRHGGAQMQRYLVEAHNPFITFGVAKLPKPAGGGLFFQNEEQWARELFDLGSKLASRILTGHAARDRIAAFLDDCNEPQKKWSSRYLLKDLRMNIGAKEVQKFVGKEILPIFEVPLAHDYKDVKKWKDNEAWFIQPKLDGGRCVAVIDRLGTVELFSRNGKTWGNFESVRQALQKWAAINGVANYVLDGEVVSLDDQGKIDFQQIQKTMMRRDGVEVGKLSYMVFDGCALGEWQDPKLSYETRMNDLQDVLASKHFPENVELVEFVIIAGGDAKGEAESRCELYVNRGFEGAIMRKAEAVVQNKRSKDLLKVKTFEDAEATVIDRVEGMGKYQGMLGTLVCKFSDFEGVPGAIFEIGSGFNDAQRKEFWDMPLGELALRTVTFKFFEKTNDGIPRFPIFKYFRSEDDIGEAK